LDTVAVVPDEELGEFLAEVPLFKGLPPHLLAHVSARGRPVSLPGRSWLYRQGESGDTLYVVREGRLELVREDPPPAETLGSIGPGEAVGELGLLTDAARALSVRSIRDCELLALDREDLVGLLGYSPDFAIGLLRVLGDRVRTVAGNRARRGRPASVLALIGLDSGLPLPELADGLVATLSRRRTAVVLEAVAGEPSEEFGHRLEAAEKSHDHVVLLAGNDPSEAAWRSFGVRQADRVLAVVRPGSPSDGLDATDLSGSELLVWSRSARTADLHRWLACLQPRAHHFIDPADPALGVARAARRITEQSPGLVLSAGGARALCHVGVVSELLDQGLALDRLGGSEVGALVGAMFALGFPPGEVARRCGEELVRRRPFNDYTAPRTALLRGRKFNEMLVRIFGSVDIEQLPMDYFCVSADLESAAMVVHRRGNLAQAVAASMALPGILPPVLDDGRVLVDGSVLSGLPIRVMSDASEGPVVGVDAARRRWDTRESRRRSVPNIIELIARSSMLGGSQELDLDRGAARLVIEPSLPEVGQFGFAHFDALVAAGRSASRTVAGELEDLKWGEG